MKKSIIILSVALGMLFVSSCAGRLDIAPPNNLTEEQIKDLMDNGSDADKQKVMNAIAAPMIKYFNYWGILGQGTADPRYYGYQGLEWVRNIQGNDVAFGYNSSANSLAGKAEYDFSIPYTNKTHTAPFWFGYAYAINQANLLLSYMTEEAAAGNDLFKDGRARGLLVRAYSYLCLMENFQDAYTNGGADKLGMSLYEKYDPKQEAVARSSAKATYEFIIKDAKEAVSLLSKVGYTAGRASSEDFDQGVANFVLARAALEFGDYQTCISACQSIINSNKYSFIKQANYGGHNTGSDMTGAHVEILPETNAFTALAVNPECILGFNRGSSNNASAFFTQLANPFGNYASGAVSARIDNRLYEKINANDFRKDAFYPGEVGDFQGASSVFYIPDYINLKFAATVGLDGNGTSHTTIADISNQEYCKFRLSEVYLMLAEAQLAGGNSGAATTTINTLLQNRTKAGAETLTFANYGAGNDLKSFIQLQWRIEMWCEGGREYYNNMRWGINVDRTGSSTHVTKNTRSWQKLTCELPVRELEDNPNTTPNGITD